MMFLSALAATILGETTTNTTSSVLATIMAANDNYNDHADDDGSIVVPSAAVEVVATVAGDGSIRTRSFSVDPCRELSLVDGCEEPSDKPSSDTAHHQQHEQPALVRVGSTSDSEEDSTEEGSTTSSSERRKEEQMIAQKASTELTTLPSHSVATEERSAGAFDCLSDQITNMFCPAEHLCLQQQHSTNHAQISSGETRQLTASCTDAGCTEYNGCTEYQLKDFLAADGVDVFATLQFWLTPSQEEEAKRGERHKPNNRTSASRRKRSKHIETIWNSWHAEQSIPLERSKSLPSELVPQHPSPASQAEETYLNDVCYDSDPESEFPQRTSRGAVLRTPKEVKSFRDRRPASIATVQEDGSCFLGKAQVPQAPRSGNAPEKFDFHPKRTAEQRKRKSDPPRVEPSELDLLRPGGEPLLRSFIQEATNTKIPLIWHRRTHGTESVKRKAPLAVTCAFEVGAHLDNLVVQPKFTWSQTFEPHLPRRKIQLSGREPDAIELLSIIRVVKPSKLNRNLYPFARLDRTCCITTNDEEFPYLVFEAASTRERDWLVNAMKMIVARLASIIIVRDEAMLLEFFTPYAALMHLDTQLPAPGPQREEPVSSSNPSLDSNGELQLVSYG